MTTSDNKTKKVLIVSFVFPPANSMGAVRVGKFAKYLPYYGWQPTVLTVDKVNGQPQTLPVEIEEANVVRTPYLDLAASVKKILIGSEDTSSQHGSPALAASRITSKLIPLMRPFYPFSWGRVPDQAIGWYRNAVRRGIKIANMDIIFSTSPPPVVQFIASQLHKQTGVPWVAEYRDPWALGSPRRRVQPFQTWEERLERGVLKRSSLLITVSEPFAKRLRNFHAKEVAVIPNGFDEDDYKENIPLTEKFSITYTGTVYPGWRDPSPLFAVVKELQQEGNISPDNFEIRFFGSYMPDIPILISKYKLDNLVRVYGFVPFAESIRRQKESTVLLLLASTKTPSARGEYTGKVFEYLAASRPIIGLALKEGVIDVLLKESKAGVVCSEKTEIKALLSKWLDEYKKSGKISSYYHPNLEVIRRFTRREQAKKLAQLLDKVSERSNLTQDT